MFSPLYLNLDSAGDPLSTSSRELVRGIHLLIDNGVKVQDGEDSYSSVPGGIWTSALYGPFTGNIQKVQARFVDYTNYLIADSFQLQDEINQTKTLNFTLVNVDN